MLPPATTHRPRHLHVDLSYACNIRCTTCRCPEIDADTGGALLPLDAAIRAIDEFVALGGEQLALYGGEPLLVAHVVDVIRHAAGRGLVVKMTTNAMAATVANTRRVLAAGLSRVTVSVDGDETGHDRIRGSGTFAKTMQGAKNFADTAAELGRTDFRLNLHATVSRANVGDLSGLIRHAARIGPRVSVSVVHFARLDEPLTGAMEALLGLRADTRRNHWRLPRDLLLGEEDLPVLAESIREMRRLAGNEGIGLIIDPALDEALDARALLQGTFNLRKTCRVFETSLILGPDGRVGSCPMLTHFSFGRVGDQPLAAIWNSETFDHLRRRLSESYLPVCQSCCRHADLI